MSFRSVVPPPDFLLKAEFSRPCGRSPNKISTLLTNVQRRNVQTLAPADSKDLNFFQMAAQGELLLLQQEIENRNYCLDVQDNQVSILVFQLMRMWLNGMSYIFMLVNTRGVVACTIDEEELMQQVVS
ncbi:unnamed protein product [Trichobilharzia regenti]|nr:unnamed protein product [Trichobilharzia regenti]